MNIIGLVWLNKGGVFMLTISETARDKFKEVMQEYPDKILRVVFEGFG